MVFYLTAETELEKFDALHFGIIFGAIAGVLFIAISIALIIKKRKNVNKEDTFKKEQRK